jgi:hypothetical protein
MRTLPICWVGLAAAPRPTNGFISRTTHSALSARLSRTWRCRTRASKSLIRGGVSEPSSMSMRPWQTVCSLPAEVARPHYAMSEGCAGSASVEPPAQGTSHAAEEQCVCRSGYI